VGFSSELAEWQTAGVRKQMKDLNEFKFPLSINGYKVVLFICLIFSGCAQPQPFEIQKLLEIGSPYGQTANQPVQGLEWKCYADVNKDSTRTEINCECIKEVCQTGRYRIMKVYPIKTVYIYHVGEPRTEPKKFFKE
jgi:hypothetical protein